MPKQNFLSPEFGTKFQREVHLFLDLSEFPFNTVWDGWKEAPIAKTSSILLSVSTQLRLVTDTDGQTDRHIAMAVPVLAVSRGKNE